MRKTDPPTDTGALRLSKLKQLVYLSAVVIGVLLGLGLFTFDYAEGTSYFSHDASACANCHIMQPQYDSWQKSSHHTVAQCIDCHLPTSFFGKYWAKAENGWNHSRAFTMQDFPEPITIGEKNAGILQDNCVRCHGDLVHELVAPSGKPGLACVHCHASVGHGARAGLGAGFGALDIEIQEK